jgi:hypothetical protein
MEANGITSRLKIEEVLRSMKKITVLMPAMFLMFSLAFVTGCQQKPAESPKPAEAPAPAPTEAPKPAEAPVPAPEEKKAAPAPAGKKAEPAPAKKSSGY